MSEAQSMRELRSQSMASTFDRVVWLDAGAISAIFTALHQWDLQPSCLLVVSLSLFGLSLFITLCVPVWRAMVNARHVETGKFRVAWEVYIAQLFAALVTGLAVLLAIAGFVCRHVGG